MSNSDFRQQLQEILRRRGSERQVFVNLEKMAMSRDSPEKDTLYDTELLIRAISAHKLDRKTLKDVCDCLSFLLK